MAVHALSNPHFVTEFIIKPLGMLISFFYPFYASFKALDSTSQESHAQWLTYWSVLASVNFAEYLLAWILKWIPLYFTLKIVFVLWLQLPITKGASIIYWKFLHPQIKKHEDRIDQALLAGSKKVVRLRDQWAAMPGNPSGPTSRAAMSSSLGNLPGRSTSAINRVAAADRVLQELEEGDMGEKGE